MHHLHPALRLPWWLRFRALRVLQDEMGSGAVRGLLVDGALYTKEAVRRLLASTVAATPAVHAALGRLNHPVGLLTTPPLRLPHRGMEGAMEAFAAVGAAYVEAAGGPPRRARALDLPAPRPPRRRARPPASPSAGTRSTWAKAPPRCTARWRGRASPPSCGAPPSARTLCPSGSTPCCRRCAACGSTRRSTSRSTSSTRRPGSRSRSTGRTRSRSSARRSPTRPPAS